MGASGTELVGGPDQYWSSELPPSRGQYKASSMGACLCGWVQGLGWKAA
jgi:hypothetical protein